MSVTVFLSPEDIKDVYHFPKGLDGKPVLCVITSGGTLHLSVEAIDKLLALGKADQARQDAAVQP